MASEPDTGRDNDKQLVSHEQMRLPGESEGNYSSPRPSKSWLKPLKKIIIAIIVIAILTAAGFFAVRFYLEDDAQPSQESSSKASTPAQSDNSLSQTFESSSLGFSIDYPGSWRTEEIGRSLIIRSPKFNYQINDGQTINGSFFVYISRGSSELDKEYLGRGFAIEPSRQINYNDPQPGQLKKTYVTDFGLDETDNFAYLVAQGTFELSKDETLGPNYASRSDEYLIGAGFTSNDLEPGLQTNLLSIQDYKVTQQYRTGIKIIQSLRLQ